MNEKLKEKLQESMSSVVPITMIVLILSVTLVPMEIGTVALFLFGAVMLIFGMGLFQLGAETSMTPLGQGVGSSLTNMKKLWMVSFIGFLMGCIITIAEPDLQVLANQVAAIPNAVLILTVAIGVGIFTTIALLRILFGISLSKLLVGLYIGLFVLSFFCPREFLSIAFDSGGVTTGPMTVPFIMALGVGLAAKRSDRAGADDSFGLIALCSVGPILMVLLLGIFFHPMEAAYDAVVITPVKTTHDVLWTFIDALPHYAAEIAVSILPVVGVFVAFQLMTRIYHVRQVIRMTIGFIYTYIGLLFFLTGVNVGFAPVGSLLGSLLGESALRWMLIPIGVVIGYFIVKAEPAVQVLNVQVEDMTSGIVTRKMMNAALSIGVACAVALAMVRVLTGISIYWILIPGYVIALMMTFFVPRVFVGIAFDSGGVASGPMTSTFLLPLSMGACTAIGGNVVSDAFGVVALVALAPLLTIQTMGIIYEYKAKKSAKPAEELSDEIIIELEEE